MFCILVVDDEENARKLLKAIFLRNGYKVLLAKDGIDALDKMHTCHVDLIVLDLMMPRMDGYEFAANLRKSDINVPILIITAKETLADKKKGFIAGADDYMVKPVDEEEMLLRVKALFRRSRIADERRLTVGETILDYDSLTVSGSGAETELPNKEFMLLYKLLSYPNKIFSRHSLMSELWDMNSDSDFRTIDVHINRLRERFKDNRDFEIVTIRGLGYKAVKKSE